MANSCFLTEYARIAVRITKRKSSLRIDQFYQIVSDSGLHRSLLLIQYKIMKNIKFESDLAKELYMEVSALADMRKINRSYISLSYIWKVWRKVYRMSFGSTRHIYMPGELFSRDEDV